MTNPKPYGNTRLGNSPSRTIYKSPGTLRWDNVQLQPNTRFRASDYGFTESGRIVRAGDTYAPAPVKPKPVRKDMNEPMRSGGRPGPKMSALIGQLIECKISNPEEYIRSMYRWDGYRFVPKPQPKSTASVRRVDPAESVKVQVRSRSGETREMSEAELVKRMQAKVRRWRERGISEDVIRQRVARKIAA